MIIYRENTASVIGPALPPFEYQIWHSNSPNLVFVLWTTTRVVEYCIYVLCTVHTHVAVLSLLILLAG